MKKLLLVVGTRPNFIKVTRFKQVTRAHGGYGVDLVHTGQHFDDRMSTVFFEQFGLAPDHWLNTPATAPAAQMGHMMVELERVARTVAPDLVMVVGDVNSTLAGALVANKMGLRLAHLESGLRSRDLGMPEEINRILTDRITRDFFITEQSGMDNLLAEGADPDALHFVGNTMIDTLVAFADRIRSAPLPAGLPTEGGHVLMTIHRPATVDAPDTLARLVDLIASVAADHPVIFPVHPRTTGSLQRFGLMEKLKAIPRVHLCEPLDYFGFQRLIATCAFVITDSGGIQEETTYRQVPCLTLRPNTERPVTVTLGTNELLDLDTAQLRAAIGRIQAGTFKKGQVPPLWDGHATERVFQALDRVL